MTTCEDVQAALLDESVARADGIDAHLATCADCRAVASAHRSALQLRGAAPLMTARRSMAEARRRAGAVFGLLLAVGGGAGLVSLELRPEVASLPPRAVATAGEQRVVRVEPEPVVEQRQVVADGDVDAQWVALMALQRRADALVVAEYREEEVTRRVFGALPQWVAPRKSSPVRALGRAASPVVFTQEDVP